MPGVQPRPPLRTPRTVARQVAADVHGGLDGVLRVATLLRGRGYDVRDLTVQISPRTASPSLVRCTLALAEGAEGVLLERLRRLPSVLSAELVGPADPGP